MDREDPAGRDRPGAASADPFDRAPFLAALPTRLREAVSADELRAVCSAPVTGLSVRERSTTLSIGDQRATSPLPTVDLTLDPPVDATWLADVWGIDQPVAVSGDVHQTRWHLLVAGVDLPDPYQRRIAADRPTAGRWTIDVVLDGRPPGPLPELVCGASPAYDLRSVGAQFLALGEGARLWLVEAASAGTSRVKVKMAEAVQLARLHGHVHVDWALGHAATYGRFADGDLASILAAHPVGERHTAGDGHSLQPGTSAWEGFGGPR